MQRPCYNCHFLQHHLQVCSTAPDPSIWSACCTSDDVVLTHGGNITTTTQQHPSLCAGSKQSSHPLLPSEIGPALRNACTAAAELSSCHSRQESGRAHTSRMQPANYHFTIYCCLLPAVPLVMAPMRDQSPENAASVSANNTCRQTQH